MQNLQTIQVSKIKPNPLQPRTIFDDHELKQLADSIRENGLQSPILVESEGDSFILVAGERRLRAHKMIGMTSIQAFVRERTNHQGRKLLIDAMTENVQRHNMHPVDEAHAYQKMHDEFKMSVREISKAMGVYETRISELLKLARLEPEIKELMKNDSLHSSHDVLISLLSIEDSKTRVKFAQSCAQRGATIKNIKASAKRLLEALAQGKIKSSPALKVAKKLAVKKKIRSKWNALKQAGKVPTWEYLVKHIESTCDFCSLREMACETICRDCPLADFVKRIVEHTDVPND